jgi:hypothetical protein
VLSTALCSSVYLATVEDPFVRGTLLDGLVKLLAFGLRAFALDGSDGGLRAVWRILSRSLSVKGAC